MEAPPAKRRGRATLGCGDPDLDVRLQRYARQNRKSGGAKFFVAAPTQKRGAYKKAVAQIPD